MHAEALVLGSEGVEVLLEKNILLGDVGEDQVDLGAIAVLAAADDGLDDLQHGSDAGTTSNHAEGAHHVGSVHEGTLGAANTNRLTNAQRGNVLADVALRVRLDQQVEAARLFVTRDGSVRTHDLLGCAVGLLDVGGNRDVLANR